MKTTTLLPVQPGSNNGNVPAVETVFFNFEEDFVEDTIRCIPMIVRFKLDACGIKLKLSEWSKMNVAERNKLAALRCAERTEVLQYGNYLRQVILQRTGNMATELPVEQEPEWSETNRLPNILLQKLDEFKWQLSVQQWLCLSNLQRFVLVKLCRPGHENKNFPVAMKEFGLV